MQKLRRYLNWRPTLEFPYSPPSYSDSEELKGVFTQLVNLGGEVAIYHALKNMSEIVVLTGELLSYAKKFELTETTSAIEAFNAVIINTRTAEAILVMIQVGWEFDSSFKQAISLDQIGTYGDNNAPYVIPWLTNKNSPIRSSAARVLGLLKSKESVPTLIDVLSDNNALVREESTKSLGLIGDERAVEPLTARLSDDSTKIRYAAAISIHNIIGKEAEIIIKPVKDQMLSDLKNRNTKLRIQAIESLAELKATDMIEELRKIANEDPDEKVRNKAKEKINELEQIRR